MQSKTLSRGLIAAALLSLSAGALAQERGGRLWLDPAKQPKAAEAYCWQLDDRTPEGCDCAPPAMGEAQNVVSPSLKKVGDDIFFWQDEERLMPNPGSAPAPAKPGRAFTGLDELHEFERL